VDLLPLSPVAGRRCTRDEAVARLDGRGFARWCRQVVRGTLTDVRLVEVPYRLFEVRVENAGQSRVQWLAVDAITGALDLYGFDTPAGAAALDPGGEGEQLPPQAPPERLAAVVEECVRRQVYARGFFQLRDLRIAVVDTGRTLQVPYWVGIRRKGDRASFEVIGAWRRRREGARLVGALAPWITAWRSQLDHAAR
jgi:hypothetical protein